MTDAPLVRQLRFTQLLATAAVLGNVVIVGMSCRSANTVAPTAEPTDILRARGLVIEDENGVERIILGAPVPDPPGADGPRAAPLAGMIIIDGQGRERGGYGTIDASDETVLTLDAADGPEIFKVAGNPKSGATLWLSHQNGAAAALTTYRGEPELHLLGSDDTVTSVPEDVAPLE